jgi:putative membrane protein
MSANDDRPPGEPDYRFTLANERTFLAWIRTALALLAGAVALGHLVPDFDPDWLRRAVSVALAVLAVLTAAGSVLRWRRVQTAVERDEPLPRSHMTWGLAGALLVIGVVVAVVALSAP